MIKVFSDDAWKDYVYWIKADRTKVKKINKLIKSIERKGLEKGLGSPEPLKSDLAGYFSRRISSDHRLIYKVNANTIFIASCRDCY